MAVNKIIKTNEDLNYNAAKTTLLDLQLKKKPLFLLPGNLYDTTTENTRVFDVSGNDRHAYFQGLTFEGATLDGNITSIVLPGTQTKFNMYYGDWMNVDDFTLEGLWYINQSSSVFPMFAISTSLNKVFIYRFNYSAGRLSTMYISIANTPTGGQSSTVAFYNYTAHHCVMTWNASTGKAISWVDGVNDYELDIAGTPSKYKIALEIGMLESVSYKANGRASHLAMYDRVLTADEIMNHAKVAGYA